MCKKLFLYLRKTIQAKIDTYLGVTAIDDRNKVEKKREMGGEGNEEGKGGREKYRQWKEEKVKR